VNADGSGGSLVAADVDIADAAVSPDGTRLTFMGRDQQIYVMNMDGSDRTRITEPPSRNFTPASSPDGTRLVFSGDPGSTTRLPSTRVEVVNADGSGRRVVTGQKDRFFSEPAWSPDGRWIAFDNWPHEDWGWVTLVRTDGSDRHNVSPELGPPTQHAVAWSPDSRRIAFVEGDGITVVAPDGAHRRCISSVGSNHAPAWSPDGSRIAFFRS
jgi:Tol biopolymer transport system component